jgi:hypothetical protein
MEPSNNGFQRTAPRLRPDMRYWLRHQLRSRDRRAAAEANCYPGEGSQLTTE